MNATIKTALIQINSFFLPTDTRALSWMTAENTNFIQLMVLGYVTPVSGERGLFSYLKITDKGRAALKA